MAVSEIGRMIGDASVPSGLAWKGDDQLGGGLRLEFRSEARFVSGEVPNNRVQFQEAFFGSGIIERFRGCNQISEHAPGPANGEQGKRGIPFCLYRS
jgi:hypothetical protein